MCRPSCCNNSGGQGAGVAAVALIIGAALIAAKIGPVVAKIAHIAVEVIQFAALTTGLVAALAVLTWATIMITRWQLRRKTLGANQTRVITMPTIRLSTPQVSRPADCLACGDTGMVLRAISDGRYQPTDCPVCEPARRAG
jgi:hypothetical protein